MKKVCYVSVEQRAESNFQTHLKAISAVCGRVNSRNCTSCSPHRAVIAKTTSTRSVRYGTLSDTSCHDIILILGYLGR